VTKGGSCSRITSVVFISFLIASLLAPLCVNAQPSLRLNPTKHDIAPVSGNTVFSSEVVKDSVSISGKTDPGSSIFIKKTIFGFTSKTTIPVTPSGSFAATVAIEIGPGFVQGVERGDIRLAVAAVKGTGAREVNVPLVSQMSGNVAPLQAGAVLRDGTPGYPHTFVAYNNPSLFAMGRYQDDTGKTVQTTKDDVAAQLAKFSAVSLHYTDNASSIALIRQYNPSVKVFAYINVMCCYKSPDPKSEYQKIVKHHPEWFLYRNAASRKSHKNPLVAPGSEQVMDLTTGWRGEVERVSKAALSKGFDGLYIDCICDNPSLCYGKGACNAPCGNMHAALNTYLDQVREAGKTNFYNGQSPLVTRSNQDFMNRTAGWMDEGFISYKGWKLSAIDMPKYASARNKFMLFFAQNSNKTVRYFYFTSALLSDGYFFYAPANTQWFSEYGTYCGNPSGQAYQLSGHPGIWARDYTAARVIVNPTSKSVTLSMPGYADPNGTDVSSVAVSPRHGVLLTKISDSF